MTNYHLRITYYPLQNRPTFISSELEKKYGNHFPETKKRTILSSLRYQNAPLLISQNSSKTSLNSRAFKNSGPSLCNSPPPTIRSIRSHK